TAILVALSRSSSGYFLGAAMLLILPWIQSLHQTRGDSGDGFLGSTDRQSFPTRYRRGTGTQARHNANPDDSRQGAYQQAQTRQHDHHPTTGAPDSAPSSPPAAGTSHQHTPESTPLSRR